MIILSLFDGMAGAYEALTRAGVKIDKYYCSEIDKYSHAVAKYNHPDIINLGDVNNWREWGIETPDLIIGGFPCQAFSFAGKQLHFDDPRGQLFFRLLEIKEHYKPKYFLFENVKMKKEIQAEINKLLKVEPIEINSALVSAQNRRRNYWTNIRGIEQPADRGILLRDILESDSTGGIADKCYPLTATYRFAGNVENFLIKKRRQLIPVIKNRGEFIEQSEKSMCLDANYWKGPDNHGQRTLIVKYGAFRGRNPENPTSRQTGLSTEQMLEIRKDEKTNCLTGVQKDNVLCKQVGVAKIGGYEKDQRVYSAEKKSPSILQRCYKDPPKITTDLQYWRKLTPLECERLQTVRDGYTTTGDFNGNIQPISNTQKYKMLGNGFTIEVIAHILRGIK